MSAPSSFVKRFIHESWIPATPVSHKTFLGDRFRNIPKSDEHSAPVVAFLNVLAEAKTTDEVARLFDGAVSQANKYHNWADPNEAYKVTDFQDFLVKVDVIVVGPPRFYKATVDGTTTIGEPIGVPLHLILDLISNTTVAYTLLTRKDFNDALKALLDGWGSYLKNDPSSNATLNEDGWFSPAGLAFLESGLGKLSFDQTYISDDPQNPKFFNTWDSFFTRKLQDEYTDTDGIIKKVRPIPAQPIGSGAPFYIYNPCESTVFRTAANVALRDTFWLKSQKYSLYDILGGYPRRNDLSAYAERLEGGSILQAFLSPQDYHRWHSPVQGKVLESGVINGYYYAALPDEGAGESDPYLSPGDPHGAIIRSQPWLTVTSTRAVFIIEPDKSSPIDLIAFIGIGMMEVSTCDITYNKRTMADPNDVEVGDELGMFHFGGSSCALIVKPKTGQRVIFQDIYDSPLRPGQHRWINSVVGQVWKEQKPTL